MDTAPQQAERTYRVPDGVAFGLLGAYLISRQVTQRFGLGLVPNIALGWVWIIPFLNNSSLVLIQAGVRTEGQIGALIATGIASVVMSTVIALILYWAGWRFGHRLAESAKKPGSPWAGIWNPKAIARAERWMETRGMFAVFLGRATEIFMLPVNLVAGASEMSIRRFLVAHTAGAAVFAAIVLWIGDKARVQWPWLPEWLEDTYGPWALRISLVLIVLLVVLMLLGQKLAPKQKDDDQEDDDQEDDDQERSTTTPSQGSNASPPEND